MTAPVRRDCGSASLQLVAVVAVAAVGVLGVAAAAGDVVLAEGRAQDAADAAALAAARALGPVGPARSAATTAAAAAAAAHDARLVTCWCGTAPVTVTVETLVTAPAARALGLTARRATARAALTAARHPAVTPDPQDCGVCVAALREL